jgi:hypothetical protein
VTSEKFKPGEEIIKAQIPDEDMPGWMETLNKGGYTSKQLDSILSQMNDTYRKTKNINFVENELKRLQQYFREKYKRNLTSGEIEYLKQGIESRIKE